MALNFPLAGSRPGQKFEIINIMTSKDAFSQLEKLASSTDFASSSAELVDRWAGENVTFEVVEPILRFMEEHPSVEFGMPGSLVHFAEKFRKNGYEDKLLESIARKPTQHTAWMLNRLINGTNVPSDRQRFIAAMERAQSNPLSDTKTRDRISRFLERLGET